MVSKENQEIFQKYNPESDLVRCPYGKASTRDLLNEYAQAAVNLYGVLYRDEFLEIFYLYNEVKVTDEELYILLLPFIIKNLDYCFYEDYLVHPSYSNAFECVEDLVDEQEGKPRYIPEKDEFIQYKNKGYMDRAWEKVQRFLTRECGTSKNVLEFFKILKKVVLYGDEVHDLYSLLDEYDNLFIYQGQAEGLLDLINAIMDNAPDWGHKGYSAQGLEEYYKLEEKELNEIFWVKEHNAGRNDPCPCGSGLKYKKCCGPLEDFLSNPS